MKDCPVMQELAFLNEVDEYTHVANHLHFTFKMPDWEGIVNCAIFEHLYPEEINDCVNILYFNDPDARTSISLRFTYPAAISSFLNKENLRKYPIASPTEGGNTDIFQLDVEVPLNCHSTDYSFGRLWSEPGFSDNSYTEILQIEPVSADEYFMHFRIKGCYKMQTIHYHYSDPKNQTDLQYIRGHIQKPIYGTFCFLVKLKAD